MTATGKDGNGQSASLITLCSRVPDMPCKLAKSKLQSRALGQGTPLLGMTVEK